jgi:hypothetical protein
MFDCFSRTRYKKNDKITYDNEYFYIINHKDRKLSIYFYKELLFTYNIIKYYKSEKSFLCLLDKNKYMYISNNKRIIFKTTDKLKTLYNYVLYSQKYIIFPEKGVYLNRNLFVENLNFQEVEKDIHKLYELVHCYGGYLYADDV